MAKLMAALYDRFLASSEAHGVGQWRQDLLKHAKGHVLEVGAGTGLNLAYYPADIKELTLNEPDKDMQQKLLTRLKQQPVPFKVSINDATIDALPMPDESIDTIVCTLVLCSVPDPERALKELYRVLKPQGTLLYLEHIAAQNNPSRLRLQRIIEPGWKLVAGNCHLTRHTEATLRSSGFTIEACTHESMRKAMPFLRPTIRGVAIKAP